MYIIDGDNVYYQDEKIKELVGTVNKTETIRIDNNTVADVISSFNMDRGEYVEASRTLRTDVYVPPVTDQQKIAQLEAENTQLKQRQAQMDGDFAAFVDQYYIDNPDKA